MQEPAFQLLAVLYLHDPTIALLLEYQRALYL